MSRSHPSTADEEPWNTGRWFISSIMSKDILISRIHNAMTWSSLRAPEQARKRKRCSLICPNVFSPPPNLPPGDNLWNLWQKDPFHFFWNYVWIPPLGQWYCFLPYWWSVLLWIKLSCFDGHFGTSPPSPPPCPAALLLSHLFPASPLSSSQGQEGEEDCGI